MATATPSPYEEAPDARQLDPGLLQAALTGVQNSRVRRKLIALIQFAQGWDVHRVAFQMSVHPETLRRWADLYHQSGIDGLDRRSARRKAPPPELPPDQRTLLTKWISEKPKIGDAALCARFMARFGVKYSRADIRSLAATIKAEIVGALP